MIRFTSGSVGGERKRVLLGRFFQQNTAPLPYPVSSASAAANLATCFALPWDQVGRVQIATAPFSLMTCSERGCSPRRNPQRRANRRGYAALLAQSLDNLPGSGRPFQVDHIPTPVATTTASSSHVFNQRYPDRKTAGDYHHDHPHTAADAALRVPVLSRQNLN